MKPVSYKRILAYIIDFIFVTLISSILTMFIPVSDSYIKANEDLMEVMKDYTSGEIDESEYLEKYPNYLYTLNKESVAVSIVLVVVSIGYYVIFACVNDGQTFGKKIMKMKIVSNDSKKLTLNNYLIRSLIINGIFLNILDIVLIIFIKKDSYLAATNALTTVRMALYALTFGMILFSQNGRGLHDIVAGTKVINVKPTEKIVFENENVNFYKENKEEVNGSVIEEKNVSKEDIKDKEPTKSKTNSKASTKTSNKTSLKKDDKTKTSSKNTKTTKSTKKTTKAKTETKKNS